MCLGRKESVWNIIFSYFEGSKDATLSTLPLTPRTPTTPVTLKHLLDFVAAEIPSKWKIFGIQLDIPNDILETYPSHNSTECFIQVFSTWKRNSSPPYTWETVINVLESRSINERSLAEEIRKLQWQWTLHGAKSTHISRYHIDLWNSCYIVISIIILVVFHAAVLT